MIRYCRKKIAPTPSYTANRKMIFCSFLFQQTSLGKPARRQSSSAHTAQNTPRIVSKGKILLGENVLYAIWGQSFPECFT